MYETQITYRALCEALTTAPDTNATETIRTWITVNSAERTWLESVARTDQGAAWPALGDEDLCRLYALSRLLEVLLHGRAQMEVEAVATLAEALGLRLVAGDPFDPILHEIVGVEQVAGAPTEITELRWPTIMRGALVLVRGGVVVRADAAAIDAEVATRSVLYWAHLRRDRRVADLSNGWGSHSQWRTRFRRDYLLGDMRMYNVDGALDVREPATSHANSAREELSPEERIELLVHRCFVRTKRPDAELWPWDDRYAISESAR